MDLKEKKLYCSQQQKQQLTEMVTKDKQLLSGKFSNNFTMKDSVEKWENIALALNSMPGANKEWKQWKKTWQDMKCSIKKKAYNNKKPYARNGRRATHCRCFDIK
ncbi:unnamed protein product [Psylliodes chrysocephalus]|uniref:Regulatory protein zeste n=1 Tax=Psylliodes chrysocephalus TaxID=3402493 RepID=A0A9P0D5E0_9CUCU|nr:unnamed protein product [Psylliodes chrysocephala]